MMVSILKEVIAQFYVLLIVLMMLVAMIGVLSIFWLQMTRCVIYDQINEDCQNETVTEKINL